MLDGRDQEAAVVAARLKQFHASVADLAPYYQQGIEPLPDGGIVLRFAQGKFPSSMSRDLSAGDGHAIRDAAGEFVRRVCLWDNADHYQVLCARRDAPQEAIKENYHLLMRLLHPDRQEGGAAGEWSESCAQRVNLAYATLGDESSRRDYDARGRSERPRIRAAGASTAARVARRQHNEVRFAKTLLAVSAVVAILLMIGLSVEDDDWGDRSALQASLARLRSHPVAGADRPRYVGATAMAPGQHASDAAAEDAEPFAFFMPLMRALVAEKPKPLAPTPKLESAQAPASAAPAAVAPISAPAPAPVLAIAIEASPQKVRIAQAPAPPAPAASSVTPRADADGPSNLEIESLVVALIAYYEAGDAEHLVGMVDGGFWRTAQMRQAYDDFFRATRARRLRLERLAWNKQSGAATARGEATVLAEYYDRTSPEERRVDVELDVGMRDGKARITRLLLFPEAR